jgi:rhodanese-related sulfurtransferase
MSLPHVSPTDAKALLDRGAVLIDVREPDEHARERIPGATSAPLSAIAETQLTGKEGQVVIFHCKTGNRTKANSRRLADTAGCEAFILDGGLDAWRKAGLPVKKDKKQPLEMNRQVQIAAGGLALAGAVLGSTLHPAFFALSGAVGAGLMFAGISGTCAMASILRVMPWNRAAAA